ncbi:hypothetical protein [Paraburkholderia youngii]|uniref:hypothetical protein n=1 Tax=Paraburkholderia youngii TaxID=2782701 RepID=UPI00158FB95F|nr:hypothetical protein [Paraburkholderia youngii]NUX58656.1 hypothetical protein [Paraburkholderia youngii]
MSYNLTGAAFGGNITLSKAGLAAGTTTTYTIGNAFTYAIKGQLYSQAAASNQASPLTDANTGKAFIALPAGACCLFCFGIDPSGNMYVTQSKPINIEYNNWTQTADLQGGNAALEMPRFADSIAPFGYVLAQATSSLASPWTFGTSNLSGVTGLTLTFRDMIDYPAQPITG